MEVGHLEWRTAGKRPRKKRSREPRKKGPVMFIVVMAMDLDDVICMTSCIASMIV